MATFTNTTKPTTATMTNESKIASTFITENKTGSAWMYNEDDINYEMTGLSFNYYGQVATIINEIKI